VKITAAVFEPASSVPALQELELAGPREGEVLVRLVATGICHTDLKAASVGSPVPRPVVLGHEGAGVVETVGAGVKKVAPGDHVVMTFGSCGRCRSCREAEPAYCYEMREQNFGCSTDHLQRGPEPVYGAFFKQSSFATYALGTERSVVKVRKDAPLELLGPLGCGIQTGAGAILNDLEVKAGSSLAVFGIGSLGLSAVMAAHLVGAGRIVAIDRLPQRLELARELGATDTIFAGDEPVTAQVMALTGSGVDTALDTTGVLPVMRQAIDVLAPRGYCGFVTAPWDGRELGVPVRNLLQGRKIRGIHQGNSNPDLFIPLLVDLFMQGRFPFDRLVRFYPFERIADAMQDAQSGEAVKPVVRFPI
jgi:aryl-alcohol dehydrogenase